MTLRLQFFFFLLALSVVCVDWAKAATQFTVPMDVNVVCTDSLDNRCTYPTSCNKNGQVDYIDNGNLNIGTTSQVNDQWVIIGGYTIDLPAECVVTCQGNCTCEGCAATSVADFHVAPPSATGGSGSSASTTTAILSMVASSLLTMAIVLL